MFTVLSMNIACEITARPLCNKTPKPDCIYIKRQTLGGLALNEMLKQGNIPVDVVIGNDEMLSWQEGGDKNFDIQTVNEIFRESIF